MINKQHFIKQHQGLFWGVSPKANLSNEAITETILNFGDEKSVKTLFQLLGQKTTQDIFFSQTSRKRHNYHPRTINFFNLYFQRYGAENPNRKSA